MYRFGIPGKATRNRHQVQANGQCFISLRDTLLRTDAFRAAQLSLCEDFTMARRLAECGEATGFYESDGLVKTGMYQAIVRLGAIGPDRYPPVIGTSAGMKLQVCWRFCWFNRCHCPFCLSSMQWAPQLDRRRQLSTNGHSSRRLNGRRQGIRMETMDILFSPLLDLPVALRLITSALCRRQVWRGRVYVRLAGGIFEPLDRSKTVSQ